MGGADDSSGKIFWLSVSEIPSSCCAERLFHNNDWIIRARAPVVSRYAHPHGNVHCLSVYVSLEHYLQRVFKGFKKHVSLISLFEWRAVKHIVKCFQSCCHFCPVRLVFVKLFMSFVSLLPMETFRDFYLSFRRRLIAHMPLTVDSSPLTRCVCSTASSLCCCPKALCAHGKAVVGVRGRSVG